MPGVGNGKGSAGAAHEEAMGSEGEEAWYGGGEGAAGQHVGLDMGTQAYEEACSGGPGRSGYQQLHLGPCRGGGGGVHGLEVAESGGGTRVGTLSRVRVFLAAGANG